MIPPDLSVCDPIPFESWPASPVPKGPPGVYTIWRGNEFIYVGISYREPTASDRKPSPGLWGRLNEHASGRRSGDQFCVYVCDRFVLPSLSQVDIANIAAGTCSLDLLTKDYVRSQLSYRFVITETGSAARELESIIRRTGLLDFGLPLLNPAGKRQTPTKRI